MSKRLQKIRTKWHGTDLTGLPGVPEETPPSAIWTAVIGSDPTQNHKYVSWILDAWKRGTFQWEDINSGAESRIADQLKRFEHNKHRLPDTAMRSLMKYKGPGELDKILDDHGIARESSEYDLSSNQTKKLLMAKARLESERYELPSGIIIEMPLTKFASTILGRNTRWCTASNKPDDNAFQRYAVKGPLLIVTLPHGERYQIHFPVKEYLEIEANYGGLPGYKLIELMDIHDSKPSRDDILRNHISEIAHFIHDTFHNLTPNIDAERIYQAILDEFSPCQEQNIYDRHDSQTRDALLVENGFIYDAKKKIYSLRKDGNIKTIPDLSGIDISLLIQDGKPVSLDFGPGNTDQIPQNLLSFAKFHKDDINTITSYMAENMTVWYRGEISLENIIEKFDEADRPEMVQSCLDKLLPHLQKTNDNIKYKAILIHFARKYLNKNYDDCLHLVFPDQAKADPIKMSEAILYAFHGKPTLLTQAFKHDLIDMAYSYRSLLIQDTHTIDLLEKSGDIGRALLTASMLSVNNHTHISSYLPKQISVDIAGLALDIRHPLSDRALITCFNHIIHLDDDLINQFPETDRDVLHLIFGQLNKKHSSTMKNNDVLSYCVTSDKNMVTISDMISMTIKNVEAIRNRDTEHLIGELQTVVDAFQDKKQSYLKIYDRIEKIREANTLKDIPVRKHDLYRLRQYIETIDDSCHKIRDMQNTLASLEYTVNLVSMDRGQETHFA